MKLVCIAIHTPGQTKLHTLNVGKLAQIYEATNKYDLVDAVSLWFNQEKWRKRVKRVHCLC